MLGEKMMMPGRDVSVSSCLVTTISRLRLLKNSWCIVLYMHVDLGSSLLQGSFCQVSILLAHIRRGSCSVCVRSEAQAKDNWSLTAAGAEESGQTWRIRRPHLDLMCLFHFRSLARHMADSWVGELTLLREGPGTRKTE